VYSHCVLVLRAHRLRQLLPLYSKRGFCSHGAALRTPVLRYNRCATPAKLPFCKCPVRLQNKKIFYFFFKKKKKIYFNKTKNLKNKLFIVLILIENYYYKQVFSMSKKYLKIKMTTVCFLLYQIKNFFF